jgi:hypothetical protein
MNRFTWLFIWVVLCVPALAVTPTKSRTSIWSAQTLTAGAANTTSSSVNLSAVFESSVSITLTNGATGPTIAAQVQPQVANDSGGTLWVNYGGALVGTTVNSDISHFSFTVPIGYAAMRLVAGSNTGQNVTVNADISTVTAISRGEPANDNEFVVSSYASR